MSISAGMMQPSHSKDKPTKGLQHAHDKFARYMLSQPAIALDFLNSYIPEEVRRFLKLDTLRVEKGSFLEKELQQTHTDILYSLEIENFEKSMLLERSPIKEADDQVHSQQTQTGYIYIVVEHQSSIDHKMPGRMLSYQAQISRQHYEKTGRFPQILPVIYYCGKKTPYPEQHSNLSHYLENSSISPHIINPHIIVVDLTTKSYNELTTNNHLSGLEIVLKHAQDRNRRAAIDFLLQNTHFELHCTSKDTVIAIFTYISEHDDDMAFFNELTNRAPIMYKEDMITIAEQWRRQGERAGMLKGKHLGMLEGKIEGKIEGKMEGQREIVQRLARHGLGLEWIAQYTDLSLADIRRLLD